MEMDVFSLGHSLHILVVDSRVLLEHAWIFALGSMKNIAEYYLIGSISEQYCFLYSTYSWMCTLLQLIGVFCMIHSIFLCLLWAEFGQPNVSPACRKRRLKGVEEVVEILLSPRADTTHCTLQ